jgi:ketosteroid isomerase-like protein
MERNMTSREEEFLKVGRFWAKVSEEHNIEKFATVLADDFVMWYNFDDVERTRAQFLEVLKNAHQMFHNQVNENTRLTATTDGFVLQATMRGVLDGKEISAPYCLVAKVRNGKVVRGDEYFDTSQLTRRPQRGGTAMVDHQQD